MFDFTQRTSALLGDKAMEKLLCSKAAVIGIGGVGGACAEALVRCGIGEIILFDHDTVDISNVNRQIFSTSQNVGEDKVLSAKNRLLSINPKLSIKVFKEFYNADTSELLFNEKPNYIIDAIDTVSSKLLLIKTAIDSNIPIVSSLGTGNRTDPTKFLIGNITETAGCGCGLARVMRRELKSRGITTLDVLYSTEYPQNVITGNDHGRHSPASVSFCPPVAGYIIASHVVKKLTAEL